MKLSTVFAFSSVLSGLAVATPVEKREIVYVTKTHVATETVKVVQTVWVDPTGAPAANPKPVAPAAVDPKPKPKPMHNGHNHPHPHKHHQHHGAAPNHAGPSGPALAPNPQPDPTPKTHAAPKPTHAPAPPSPPPSGGSGQSYSGDMTYYDVGLGSCGLTSSAGENVVALSYLTMKNGANPNDNPLCGKTITINYNGKTQTAKVVDTCMGCQGAGDLDMSTSLFSFFAPMSVGRVTSGMTWSFN